jgi:hypothetical protein
MPKSLANTKVNIIHDRDIEETFFVEWTKQGSIAEAQRSLKKLGYVTSGGRPYDPTVISRRAYHWLAFHPHAARKYLSELADLKFADDDFINYWVAKSVMGLKSESEVMTWIREYKVVFDVNADAPIPPDEDISR